MKETHRGLLKKRENTRKLCDVAFQKLFVQIGFKKVGEARYGEFQTDGYIQYFIFRKIQSYCFLNQDNIFYIDRYIDDAKILEIMRVLPVVIGTHIIHSREPTRDGRMSSIFTNVDLFKLK